MQNAHSTNLYSYQADALFVMTLNNFNMGLGRQTGKTTLNNFLQENRHLFEKDENESERICLGNEQARLCLWLTYNIISNDTSNGLADSRIIWWLRSNYNMESHLVNTCLKALANIFECVSVFTFANDKKCKKRYTTNKKDQALIESWCKDFEEKNPGMKAIKSRLKIR